MRKLRVGVVGLGRGVSHVAAFHHCQKCTVVAVCDQLESRTSAVSREFGVPRTYSDYSAMLAGEELDIVAIATPDQDHARQALQAMRAGCHVLCEVPAATTLAECDELVRVSEETDRKLQMGNEVRWFPCIQAAKNLAQQGDLGELAYGEAEYFHNLEYLMWTPDGQRTWRNDLEHPQATTLAGGMHAIDTLSWLLDEPFTEVKAYGNHKGMPYRAIDDLTVALYRTPSGSIAKVASYYSVQRPYCLYFSLYGNKGSFERNRLLDPRSEANDDYVFFSRIPYMERMMPLPVAKYHHPGFPDIKGLGHGTSDFLQAEDLVDAILEDRQPAINAREAANSCAAAICALTAAESGNTVTIPNYKL